MNFKTTEAHIVIKNGLVVKTRFLRGYFLPKLETKLITNRLKKEQKILKFLSTVKTKNFITPQVKDIDLKNKILITQYIQSVPLKDYYQQQSKAQQQRLKQLVLTAVTELHSLGIAHNDLNLNNLLITADQQLVMIDFSFAKITTKSKFFKLDFDFLNTQFLNL